MRGDNAGVAANVHACVRARIYMYVCTNLLDGGDARELAEEPRQAVAALDGPVEAVQRRRHARRCDHARRVQRELVLCKRGKGKNENEIFDSLLATKLRLCLCAVCMYMYAASREKGLPPARAAEQQESFYIFISLLRERVSMTRPRELAESHSSDARFLSNFLLLD